MASMAVVASKEDKPLRFLDLSPELRNRIYGLVVGHRVNDCVITPTVPPAKKSKLHTAFVDGEWREGYLQNIPVENSHLAKLPMDDLRDDGGNGLDPGFDGRWEIEMYRASHTFTVTHISNSNDSFGCGAQSQAHSVSRFQYWVDEKSAPLEDSNNEDNADDEAFEDDEAEEEEDKRFRFKICEYRGHLCTKTCLTQPPITRVSCKLREESLTLFYGINSIHFLASEQVLNFGRAIGDTNRGLIKNFTLSDDEVKAKFTVITHEDAEPVVRCEYGMYSSEFQDGVWGEPVPVVEGLRRNAEDVIKHKGFRDTKVELAQRLVSGRLCGQNLELSMGCEDEGVVD